MKTNRILLISMFVLLLSGWFLFQAIHRGEVLPAGEPDFRSWFWEQRALDLVVQIALVFAGALGIAAILPLEENDD
jgi:hypothetical protein